MFDTAGVWLGYGKGAGTSVAVVRDQVLRVTRLVHEFGREIRVAYARDLVSRVTATGGEQVEYRYDEVGRLIEVESVLGVRSYRWNADGLIDKVTAASGVVECVNTYDEQRRVVSQVTEFGREIEFSYVGRATGVADTDGSNSNSWIADRYGRLIRVVDTDHQAQSMTYDQHSNLLTVTERDGAETVCVYDRRGRLTRRVSPEGVDLKFSYDNRDRVVEICEGDDPRVRAGEGRSGVRGEAVTSLEYAGEWDRWPSRVIDAAGGITQLAWERGLLTRVTDPVGTVTFLSYDEQGDLVGVTDGVGNETRYVRDRAGHVLEMVAPSGARERFTWEGALLTGREAADGAKWVYEYGAAGQLTVVIDPMGAKTSYQYGVHGRLERVIDALGRATECGFDAFGNPEQVVNADGSVWQLRHDGLSRLREVIDPVGSVWAREYGVTGELTGRRDPVGVTQEISRNRQKGEAVTRAAGVVSSVAFDRYGRPVTTTVDGEQVSEARYDLMGRMVEQIDAEGGVTRVTYDLAGKPVEVYTPEGRRTRVTFDLAGRPSEVTDPIGGVTKLRYDEDSRVVQQVLPSGDTAVFEYDQVGRVLREDIPGVGVTRFRYDAVGRLVWTQGPKFGRREFVYDLSGQLIRAVNGVGGITHYEYDLLGRLVKVIDPAGGVTTRTYTLLGRVAEVTDPLGRKMMAEYDAAGKLTGWRDAAGTSVGLSYDSVGRLAQVSEDERLVAEVASESVWSGCITDHTKLTATGAAGVMHRVARDPRGLMLERTRDEQSTTWGYDGDGLRTRLRTPDGREVAYVRDGAGQVTRVEHPVFGAITYEYDADGHLTRSLAGNLLQSWEYEHGKPATYTRTDAEGASTTRIGYDEDGRIAQVKTSTESTDYTYDGAGQLTHAVTVDDAGVTVSSLVWEYDVAGRLTRRVSLSDEVGFAYDAAGQLVRAVVTSRGDATEAASSAPAPLVTTYEYDVAGRRIAEHGPAGETRYEWSAFGSLSEVTTTTPDGETTCRKVWMDVMGELAELDGEEVVWDAASGDPTPLKVGDAPVFRFPGSVTGAGETVFGSGWRMGRGSGVADPWDVAVLGTAGAGLANIGAVDGNAVAGGDPLLERLQSTGISITPHGSLTFNGLEHLGARLYQPGTHAFLTTDPLPAVIGAGWAGNPYAYAGNDPVGMLDPAGLTPEPDSEFKARVPGFLDGVVKAESVLEFVWAFVVKSFPGGIKAYEKWRGSWGSVGRRLSNTGKIVPVLGGVLSAADLTVAIANKDEVGYVRHGGALVIDIATFFLLQAGLIPGVVAAGAGIVWDVAWNIGDSVYKLSQNPNALVEYYQEDPWMLLNILNPGTGGILTPVILGELK
ncbi:hypothetical protein G7068_12125 [Leucobacter viscericola]|uniref:Teneurin-like YD-shell domain-containing protein n=1 Tax=Leucobacter viscericola TaxID=2714935 RepID=A0A6G7XHA1_9MICO|nr:RHS repeat-associated core domain-containing protein [Leucobacter viscericola]QIK63856.1 hypothetical protein G7068_12125 [Leucobacter viscericola]